MKLIASITIDIYEDRVETWSQERENLTKDQKEKIEGIKERAKKITLNPQQTIKEFN